MPPRKRPATAQTGRGNKRARTAEQAQESHTRGIRTRRQLIDNPDAESGSEDSEEAGAEEEEDGHDSSEELLSSLSSEQVDMCVSQARMQIKRALIAPRVLGDQGQNVIEDLFSALLRGESNSALLLGPHGTGKTSLIAAAVDPKKDALHLLRLHSTLHPNDKVAVRELVRQLVSVGALAELYAQDLADFDDEVGPVEPANEQEEDLSSTDDDLLESDDEEAVHKAKLRKRRQEAREAVAKEAAENSILASVSTATAHLLSLLARPAIEPGESSSNSTSKKPIVIVLDNMDEFALRPKQALLYVLLDAVQASSYAPGLLVLATSTRGDTLDLLEKRVKSRFSHRVVHMRPPAHLEAYTTTFQDKLVLVQDPPGARQAAPPGWSRFVQAWNQRVQQIVGDVHVQALLANQIETSWDMRALGQVVVRAMAMLAPPLPTAGLLARALAMGDVRGEEVLLRSLTVPQSTLLAAALRVSHIRGQETFTLAMLQAELTSYLSTREKDKRQSKTGLANPAILRDTFRSLLALSFLVPAVVATNLSDLPDLAAWLPPVVSGAARGARGGPLPIAFMPLRLAVLPRDLLASFADPARTVPLDQRLSKWAQKKIE